jgi:hypothetical protein
VIDVLILFPEPDDPPALDALLDQFVPDLKGAAGIHAVRMSAGDVMSRGGPPPYVRIVEARFESLADWMGWVMSPGRAEHGAEFDRFKPVVLFFEANEG